MKGKLTRVAAAALENGWELLETYSGPRYVRRTAATFGTVTETVDVYLTGGERPTFHHAWYMRQSPDPVRRGMHHSDSRYDVDQFEHLLAKFTEKA